jgi:Mn-containing catalase
MSALKMDDPTVRRVYQFVLIRDTKCHISFSRLLDEAKNEHRDELRLVVRDPWYTAIQNKITENNNHWPRNLQETAELMRTALSRLPMPDFEALQVGPTPAGTTCLGVATTGTAAAVPT